MNPSVCRFGSLLAAMQVMYLCSALPTYAQVQDDQKDPANRSQSKPITLGWAERARIFPGNLPVQAKLDTGANTSSLNVEAYELFKLGGKQWIRFTALNRANARRDFVAEVVRISKTKNNHGPMILRPVVRLEVCIANIRKVAELNISRRKGFIYKLLLGRRFLANTITVDASRKFTTEPRCGH